MKKPVMEPAFIALGCDIVTCMQYYLGELNCKVDDNNKSQIITYEKPNKNASADSISRWVKKKLTNAGIDTNIYKVHSCRAAPSNKAKIRQDRKCQYQKYWNEVGCQQIVI